MVVKAIVTTLGPQMRAAGVKWIFTDNDSKLHQQQVSDAWAQFGIRLWPGACKRCWDRRRGGFPVYYPEFMPLDRTIHNRWKNGKNGGLYSLWKSRK